MWTGAGAAKAPDARAVTERRRVEKCMMWKDLDVQAASDLKRMRMRIIIFKRGKYWRVIYECV